jgi:glycosyltransferase involved in cell wall biosynthesis
MPKVSIIVPNYNHARYLEQRIDSILNQTFEDYELILLDDCSTDNSREIIERYRSHPKVSEIIYNETNSGTSYKQWYKGISYAKGELIWIAESDDWCDNRFLEVLVPHFDDKEVVLGFVNSKYIYSLIDVVEPSISNTWFKYDGCEFIANEMIGDNEIVNASMVIFRKQRFLEVKDNGFNKMKLCGDWLLWIQIINGFKIVYIPDRLNYFRKHVSNSTNSFRARGLDFIEGLKVMKVGKKICHDKINKKKIYINWLDRYHMFKKFYPITIKLKVYFNLLIKDPNLFLFIAFKNCKSNFKTFLRFDV